MYKQEEEIRKLIAQDKIDKAIDLLFKLKEEVTVDENQILILKNQWTSLKDKYILGIMTSEEYSSRKNKFLNSLLLLLNPESTNIIKTIEELEQVRSENYNLKKELAFYRDKDDNFNGYHFLDLKKIFSDKKITIGKEDAFFYKNFNYCFSELTNNDLIEKQLDYNEFLIFIRRDLYKNETLYFGYVIGYFGVFLDTGVMRIVSENNYTTFEKSQFVELKLTNVGEKYLIRILKEMKYDKDE